METRKIAGTVLFVVGILVLLLFATADILGIGAHPDFGPWQIAGTIIGAIVAIVGIVILLRKPEPTATGR